MANDSAADGLYGTMLSEHRELMREIAGLRRWWKELDEYGRPNFGEMGTRLKVLRDVLKAHFEGEEAGGYLAAALAAAPRFTSEAEQLRKQHRQFLKHLDEFIERLQSYERPFHGWDKAHTELEDFLLNLRQHEAAENSIVQAAFGNDEGAAD